MSNFKKAVSQKLRFNLRAGIASVEDLFDLPLTSEKRDSLDSVARSVNKQLKEAQEDSFVQVATKGSRELQLKLDIVKEIIADKLAESEARKTSASNKVELERLLALKAAKQDEAKRALTEEELDAEIAKLTS